MSARRQLNDDDRLAHFRARVVADALAEATAGYWLRRAEQFEAAMHKPGDFPGLCSVAQIEANNAVLAEKAQACRNRAAVEAGDLPSGWEVALDRAQPPPMCPAACPAGCRLPADLQAATGVECRPTNAGIA